VGKYESDADAVLEKKGVEPDDPLILLTLGDKTREVYKGFIDDAKGDTIADRQRDALDKTFKQLCIIEAEKWRDSYKKNGQNRKKITTALVQNGKTVYKNGFFI